VAVETIGMVYIIVASGSISNILAWVDIDDAMVGQGLTV
jgi:hypothetical protein